MKVKVGKKVRITGERHGRHHQFHIGDIANVVKVFNHHGHIGWCVCVFIDNIRDSWWYALDDV
jgi:hypothetical protein